MKIVVLDYGAGNVFSVSTALNRLGGEVVVSDRPEEIRSADRVIFPGVGQASAAMERLRQSGLAQLIPELKMPVLGICLGMQLMCRHTEENNTEGLGIFPLSVVRMQGEGKIPHMGWNRLIRLQSPLFAGLKEGEWMYFVHSYAVPVQEYTLAACDYYGMFAAAIGKDNFYGCQFHPEKSGCAGERILENFLNLKD